MKTTIRPFNPNYFVLLIEKFNRTFMAFPLFGLGEKT